MKYIRNHKELKVIAKYITDSDPIDGSDFADVDGEVLVELTDHDLIDKGIRRYCKSLFWSNYS